VRANLRFAMMLSATIAVGETADFWARRTARPDANGLRGGSVVVLGYPGHGRVGRGVQRWRAQMAVDACRRFTCNRVVFTGGAIRSTVSEAQQMATRARSLGLTEDRIVLEERSTNTWENVTFAGELIRDDGPFIFVSDGMHARRAVRYWQRQYPDRSDTACVDPTFRLFSRSWIKAPSAVAHMVKGLRHSDE